MSDFTDGMKPVIGHVTPDSAPLSTAARVERAKKAIDFLKSKVPPLDSLMADDDHEAALDDLPEDQEDKPKRWKTPRSGLAAAAAEVDRAIEANAEAVYREDRAFVVAQLESAAIRLRDAELEKANAVKQYQEALNAFNKFVAPVPG